MNVPESFKSPKLKTIVICLGAVLVVLLIFQAGMYVGYRRATFSYHWDSNYMRGMNDPHSAFAPFMRETGEPNSHGAMGQIVSVHLPEIMVKGSNGPEQIVVIGPDTAIRNFRDAGTTTDLKAGADVIVVGVPDDNGQIQASFVRILPPPSARSASTSTTTR